MCLKIPFPEKIKFLNISKAIINNYNSIVFNLYNDIGAQNVFFIWNKKCWTNIKHLLSAD